MDAFTVIVRTVQTPGNICIITSIHKTFVHTTIINVNQISCQHHTESRRILSTCDTDDLVQVFYLNLHRPTFLPEKWWLEFLPGQECPSIPGNRESIHPEWQLWQSCHESDEPDLLSGSQVQVSHQES